MSTGGPTTAADCRIQRRFVQLEGPASRSNGSFRVLQWNLLADGLAQHGDFVRAKPEVLEWAYRKPLILAEVQEAQADILCFQELNYFDELAAELGRSGYRGSFLAKQRSAALKYSSPADGIAIFWRVDRFHASAEPRGFHFVDGSGAAYPQGCMHVLLADRDSTDSAVRQVLVVTTHLKAKEGADLERIRLEQVQQLLGHVRDAAQFAGAGPICNGAAVSSNGASRSPAAVLPLVVAGDFNTVPGSPPCQALASPPWSLQSIWSIPAAEPTSSFEEEPPATEASKGGGGGIEAADQQQCLVPEFSTWKFRSTGESKRVIDHVWFTQGAGGLRITRRWRMPSEREIGPNGLPCGAYPSDHLALCAEFDWVVSP